MIRYLILCMITLMLSGSLYAQKGKISGKVTDAGTGDVLIGVAVFIEGTTTGASSDLDGLYTIANLTPGSYQITARYISFKTKTISGVQVRAGETSVLNIVMEENRTDLKEFIVESTYNRESASVQLLEQKNASIVSDGISADIIRKTPDNAASDVMKRVSGASIQENKFAVIRGLNDRYNAAYINGSPLPSTESDRKAFSFDLFPASTIDNLVIYKTAAPDLPGEFAGGIIQISTKEIPEDPFLSVSSSAGYNTITTGRTRLYGEGSKTDWLGFDNGTRALPKGLPDQVTFKSASLSDPKKLEYGKLFSNNWTLNRGNAPLNNNMQVSAGVPFKIFGKQAGFIIAGSRSASYRFSSVDRRLYDVNDDNQILTNVTDSLNKYEVLSGALFNFSIKPGKQTKISFKNSYTLNGEDQTIMRTGANNLSDSSSAQAIRNTAFWYTENKLFTSQLSAEQVITPWKIKIKAGAGYSNIQRDVPDFRRVSYSRLLTETDAPFRAQIGSNVQLEQAGRFYSRLNEDMRSGSGEIFVPLDFIKNTNFGATFKTGYFYQERVRQFDARQFGYIFRPGAGVQASIREQALDSIFDPENFVFKSGRFFMIDEATNPNDRYHAFSSTGAAYLMLDQKLFDKLRLVWGFRQESFRQNLDALSANSEPVAVRTQKNDWLPSLNATFALNAKTNIRLSASRTLSRPEFREIAPFAFYDFNIDYVVAGRPALTTASINNYDLRYEFYPGGGQIISVSLFAKQFTNAIEYINDLDVGAGSRRFGYANVPQANNIGVETELRKNFAFLDSVWNTKFLSNLSFIGNFALIYSAIDVSSFGLSATGVRPLQGQSPYIINTGLQYTDPESGDGASIMINRVGRRIAFVGNVAIPDIYEHPRTVLDIQLTKRVLKKLDIKLTVADLFAQDQSFYMDLNKNKKYDRKEDNTIFNYTFGTTISLGLSIRL
jgi:hypothetical protein